MSDTLSPAKDNTIYLSPQEDPLSNGAGNRIFAGGSGNGTLQRALLHFDIAGNLPADSRIEGVVLTLNRVMVAPLGNGTTIDLHRLEKNWGEGSSAALMGQGMGGAPATGDATWDHTFFDTDLWDSRGGDFTALPHASAETSSSSSSVSLGCTPEMVADVQTWLEDPENNFGWILVGDETANGTSNGFGSKDDDNAGVHPQLVIQYSMATSTREVISNAFDLKIWPNPSRGIFSFEFTLEEKANVSLAIYDLLGNRVYSMPPRVYPSGRQFLQWEGQHQAGVYAGFYLYELIVGAARIGGRILRLP